MGAWSHESFGNDTASDWAYELEETAGLSHIEATIDKALEQSSEYLEAPYAVKAVAAAEVLAKLLGRGTQSDPYTDDLDNWIKSIDQKPSPALLQKARQVIDRILAENSELRDLWQDSKVFKEWQASMSMLLQALSH